MRENNDNVSNADLSDARVVGFFSLPPASLAEANPSAYNLGMAAAPAGAGSCAHCGNGILHHVIVRLPDGRRVFIGRDCAGKIGGELGECVRDRMTADEKAARDSDRNKRIEAFRASEAAAAAAFNALREARAEHFRDVLDALNARDLAERRGPDHETFWASLAGQLVCGPLSYRQAEYVIGLMLGRPTKKAMKAIGADAWDKLAERLCSKD